MQGTGQLASKSPKKLCVNTKKKQPESESESDSEPLLPQLPRPAKSYYEAQTALAEFGKRVPALLDSSPSRNRFNLAYNDAQKYLSRGSLHELDIFFYKAAKAEEIRKTANISYTTTKCLYFGHVPLVLPLPISRIPQLLNNGIRDIYQPLLVSF